MKALQKHNKLIVSASVTKGSLRLLDDGYCCCMFVLIQNILSGGTNSVRDVWRTAS